jgi:hypothetical protein
MKSGRRGNLKGFIETGSISASNDITLPLNPPLQPGELLFLYDGSGWRGVRGEVKISKQILTNPAPTYIDLMI